MLSTADSDHKAPAGAALSVGLNDGGSQGLGVFELTVPPGANVPPPHSHALNEEFFYVLEGSLRSIVGTLTIERGAGQAPL